MTEARRDFTRDEIVELLTEVGALLHARGREAAVYVVGGAAMAMVFDSRRITRDIDALASDEPDEFWAAVREVGQRHRLDDDWVNSRAAARGNPIGSAS